MKEAYVNDGTASVETIHIRRVSEVERRMKGTENLFKEVMAELNISRRAIAIQENKV